MLKYTRVTTDSQKEQVHISADVLFMHDNTRQVSPLGQTTKSIKNPIRWRVWIISIFLCDNIIGQKSNYITHLVK